MTVLTALAGLYDRLAEKGEVAAPGYAPAKISFELVLSPDGEPLELADIRDISGKKAQPRELEAPALEGARAAGIKPMFLWDKTAYALGVVNVAGKGAAPEPGQGRRTADEHAAFVQVHKQLLAGTDDPGLLALLAFLDLWQPEMFAARGFPLDALDQNIVFRLKGEYRHLHDRPAARTIWGAADGGEDQDGMCLVTGQAAPLARLHPMLRGVPGAQSSGASLVSFNLSAFESYGHSQGANAPVSKAASFAYTTALNWLLTNQTARMADTSTPVEVEDQTAPGGRRRLYLADTTVVFWADASGVGEAAAAAAEDALFSFLSPPDDASEALKIRAVLEDILRGRPLQDADPHLDRATRMYLLGLAPNAARLAVRFWLVDSFGNLARHAAQHWEDLNIDPPDRRGPPRPKWLVEETALQGKSDNVSPRLGGEVMRAILTGQPYPRTLLSGVVQRVRADGEINGRRAAICKAVVNRAQRFNTEQEDVPVALDRQNTNPAYRLGRLFAMLESAQSAALPGLNATIKDRYFAAACATPRRVFPLLNKNAVHHLAQLRKTDKGGLAHWMETEIAEIWAGLNDDLPSACRLEEQGRFIAGYYHQRYTKKNAAGEATPEATESETSIDFEGEN
ncbi:MAG: type I-C CRISPR-associated protein Cas8c/Csd1 [Rhodospirillaceae bacterium]|nr:type I-C CRISPR-associated protein Cas8c/Csd1 [Rhodospirillaceae bacterium]